MVWWKYGEDPGVFPAGRKRRKEVKHSADMVCPEFIYDSKGED